MRPADALRYAVEAIARARVRSALMLAAMAVGVAAVVLLTGLGEAARRFVVAEFSSLGTNLVIVVPGRSETTGGTLTAGIGGTTRPLTLEDAQALVRHYAVSAVTPMVVGAASAQYAGLERDVPVLGTTHSMLAIRRWSLAAGSFLPQRDWSRAQGVCVIGGRVRAELFRRGTAVGRWMRLGANRCRVIGVLGTTGRSIGVDVQETVIIPVASAMNLFDTQSLFRVLVDVSPREAMPEVIDFIRRTITARHRGEEDVTVITQDAVLGTFDQILVALTAAVGGIAGISLAVAGVLIMNVMLVSVSQRTAEIGVLKALGATRRQVVALFLLEATLLSLFGALIGLALGMLVGLGVQQLYPILEVVPPWWAVLAALSVALGSGLIFGSAPARRAARLDPVAALARR